MLDAGMSTIRKDPWLGRTIAQRYRLIAKLGDGGMATVFLARHVLIERLSAIKFLHAELGNDEAYKGRFLREARAVNRINHPNIVEITDYGETEGLVYLVMEYVPGEALNKHLERASLGWRRAAGIGIQIAAALGRAHEMGVIHRDLKPANVLIVARRGGGDLVKLTDFGVAKMLDAPTITTHRVAFGTPGYVAPEYCELGSIDARTDLFSLGVLLYETTSGALPFGEHGFTRGPPFPMDPPVRLGARVADVPPLFEDIVMTLLARDPDDRPRDGFEAFDLLKRVLELGAEGTGSIPLRSGDDGSGDGEAGEEPAGHAHSPARRPGPHLTTAPVETIGPACARALAQLEAHAARTGASLPAGTLVALAQARKQVAMVDQIARLVASDTETVEIERGRGRAVRAELGRQLDEVARERSKALGWAGTILERSDQVRSRRASGEQPVNAVEAMVWEEAALDQEEESTRARADGLSAEMVALQAEISRQNERLEHEMLVTSAKLEGHIAALRSMALEAWISLEEAARRLEVTLGHEADWVG